MANLSKRQNTLPMTRYTAQFSGDGRLDERATWLAWPELLRDVRAYDGTDLLADLPDTLRGYRDVTQDTFSLQEEYQFYGLTVELNIGGST